jgi:predicted nucleic acid-binding protein
MHAYVDASVILRFVLDDGPNLPGFLELEATFASELTETESLRTLDRLNVMGRIARDEVPELRQHVLRALRHVEYASVNVSILRRAADPFPVPLGTLDAIHLATAIMLRDYREPDLAFATHDQQLAFAARTMGFHVIGP